MRPSDFCSLLLHKVTTDVRHLEDKFEYMNNELTVVIYGEVKGFAKPGQGNYEKFLWIEANYNKRLLRLLNWYLTTEPAVYKYTFYTKRIFYGRFAGNNLESTAKYGRELQDYLDLDEIKH